MFFRRLGLLTAACVIASSLHGAAIASTGDAGTHYVAPGGSDAGNGSFEAPWGSLRHALESLEPGDRLLVRGGVYRERITHASVTHGNESAPVTVSA